MIVFSFVFVFISRGEAAWQGPAEILSGIWGNDVGQFGLRQGDSEDDFPDIEAVTFDGKIILTDVVNKKQIVFDSAGGFIKEVKWVVKNKAGGKTTYDIPEFSFGTIAGFSADGNLYSSVGDKYFLTSPTGQLLKTYTERPLELGRVKTQKIAEKQWKVTVKYPDKEWTIIRGPSGTMRYMRDLSGNLHGVGNTTIIRYNNCGKEVTRLKMPEVSYQGVEIPPDVPEGSEVQKPDVLEEYGSPVLGPNGDVYTWKRTPDKYSIVKWTWQDDPNAPSGPDAPTGLAVTPSTTGLYLTWKASPQDPGCVTGYEIARSTSSGGVYTTLATVDKGVLKYNDTTAAAGTTYYYKIRAVSGMEYSPYTAEVSGKR
jgi:hypothetical protein